MKPLTKACASVVSLVIGMFLLLEGSRMMHPADLWIDLSFMAVGVLLVLAYFPLMGNYLELGLRATRTVTLMPILLALGVIVVYQGAIRPIEAVSRALFCVIGITLILGSAFVLYRAAKR